VTSNAWIQAAVHVTSIIVNLSEFTNSEFNNSDNVIFINSLRYYDQKKLRSEKIVCQDKSYANANRGRTEIYQFNAGYPSP
jgi:hypothetical protein